VPRNFEDVPTHHPDALGDRELGGFTVTESVKVDGVDGLYSIEKLFPDTNNARVRALGELEEDSFDVPLERLKKLEG